MKKVFKSFLSHNPTSITAGLIIVVLALFLMGIPIFDLMELKTYDLRFLLKGTEKPSPNIVLAVIDEKSLDTEGRWPWSRSKIAKVIDILSQDGAKVIGFDIVFSEPDQNNNLEFLKKFDDQVADLKVQNSQLMKFIENSKINADNDLTLANSIKRSNAKIVLGHFFHISQAGLDFEISQEKIENQLDLISNSRYPLVRYELQDMYTHPFIPAYVPEANIEIISKASESSGYFNMFPDHDGVVRWIPLILKCGDDIFSPLSFQVVWNYLDNPQTIVKVSTYGIEGIQMGEIFIPTDETGQVLINYLGPEETFPHYSLSDILNDKFEKGTFDNKIVLIGVTAIGVYDMRNTPFSPVFPGLEIHATVVDNIIKKNFLHKPKWARIYDILAIIVLGLLPGILLPRLSAIKAIIFTAALFIVHIFVSRLFFTHFGLWINIVYPLLTLIVVYTSLTLYHYITEERERKKIRGAFSYYVSSSVVNEMLKNPDKLKLGGDKKDLSVLFSDIRGFTTISEGLTPEELAAPSQRAA